MLALTANRHRALHGVRPGARLAGVARRLRVGKPFSVRRNAWYLMPRRQTRGVLKVERGVIEEIGIASGRVTRTRPEGRRLFRSFF